MPLKAYENQNFIHSKEARTIRILSEYYHPKVQLDEQNVMDTIVLFGSARIHERSVVEKEIEGLIRNKADEKQINRAKNRLNLCRYYDEARILSKMITEWGREISQTEKRLLVCTGGGPGIMEAGNRGALDAGGVSVALNISLPFEQVPNSYVTNGLCFEFHYFFMRKFWFLNLSKGLIVFPGGFGTMDELFETLTLMQTRKTSEILPIIMYGSDFWKKMIHFDVLIENSLIHEDDLDLLHFVDSPLEAMRVLRKEITF
ncbi:MAG: TIGR00730 family Rossman fold protein [Leptospiraceae bacterium]|nr:TIGR00730 family Rossman fold protein [Leptospiraceae bacterium]